MGRPESPPLAATEHTAGAARQASPPQFTDSVGLVLSMPIVSIRQSDALPATSTTRVSSLCEPAALIETAGVVVTAPLSSLYSIRARPSRGSRRCR